MKIERFEKVFAYLNNELSPDQIREFEQDVLADPELAEELELQRKSLAHESGAFETALNQFHRHLQAPSLAFGALKPLSDQLVLETLEQLGESGDEANPAQVGERETTLQTVYRRKASSPGRDTRLLLLLKVAAVAVPLLIAIGGYWWISSQAQPDGVAQMAEKSESQQDEAASLNALLAQAIDDLPASQSKPAGTLSRDVETAEPGQGTTMIEPTNTKASEENDSNTQRSANERLNRIEIPRSQPNRPAATCSLQSALRSLKNRDFHSARRALQEVLARECPARKMDYAKYYLALALLSAEDAESRPRARRLLEEARNGSPGAEDDLRETIEALLKHM